MILCRALGPHVCPVMPYFDLRHRNLGKSAPSRYGCWRSSVIDCASPGLLIDRLRIIRLCERSVTYSSDTRLGIERSLYRKAAWHHAGGEDELLTDHINET